jgi:hypothetical protein
VKNKAKDLGCRWDSSKKKWYHNRTTINNNDFLYKYIDDNRSSIYEEDEYDNYNEYGDY